MVVVDVLEASAKRIDVIDQWIELIQTDGPQIWVGLWISVLAIGFVLCAGNLRRQVLIGIAILLWGASYTYYQEFYVMPIARYAWFPYWVLVETTLLIATVHANQINTFCSAKLNIIERGVTAAELRQESIILVFCALSISTNIFQLASALAGFGRLTGVFYDFSNRLLLSTLVIVLVVPGISRVNFLKEREV
jgi:hypothetical protein